MKISPQLGTPHYGLLFNRHLRVRRVDDPRLFTLHVYAGDYDGFRPAFRLTLKGYSITLSRIRKRDWIDPNKPVEPVPVREEREEGSAPDGTDDLPYPYNFKPLTEAQLAVIRDIIYPQLDWTLGHFNLTRHKSAGWPWFRLNISNNFLRKFLTLRAEIKLGRWTLLWRKKPA